MKWNVVLIEPSTAQSRILSCGYYLHQKVKEDKQIAQHFEIIFHMEFHLRSIQILSKKKCCSHSLSLQRHSRQN